MSDGFLGRNLGLPNGLIPIFILNVDAVREFLVPHHNKVSGTGKCTSEIVEEAVGEC